MAKRKLVDAGVYGEIIMGPPPPVFDYLEYNFFLQLAEIMRDHPEFQDEAIRFLDDLGND